MYPADPTPAPHLPAPLPYPAALLQRAQGTLGLLREVVQESSAEYWYERGKAASAWEKWEEAGHSFQRCILLDSKHWRGKLQLAALLAYQQIDNKHLLTSVFEISPADTFDLEAELSSEQWHSIQANFLQRKKPPIKYLQWLTTIPADDDCELIISTSIVYWISGKYDEAREELSELNTGGLGDKRRFMNLWHRLSGLLWLQNNQCSSAIDSFRAAIMYTKTDFMAHYYLGIAKLRENFLLGAAYSIYKQDDILKEFNYAIANFPNGAAFYVSRGAVKESLGDYEEALTNYVYAIEIGLRDKLYFTTRDAYECQIQLYVQLKDRAKAILLCQQLFEIGLSTKLTFILNLALTHYEQLAYYKEAIEVCDRLIELEKDDYLSRGWRRRKSKLTMEMNSNS